MSEKYDNNVIMLIETLAPKRHVHLLLSLHIKAWFSTVNNSWSEIFNYFIELGHSNAHLNGIK
jgi:hypothetical protein